MTHRKTTQYATPTRHDRPGTRWGGRARTGGTAHTGGRARTAYLARGALLTTAALLTVGASAPAAARDEPSGDWLRLTVTRGDGARPGDTRAALLRCDPPRGHAHAAQACDRLASANGDIGALAPTDGFCTMVYAPVTAHARGEWGGRPVEFTRTFANSCLLAAWTGPVFALDD
ncbi:SSI family serine proteinase inhibitor [Streptomyces adustus]|uniref:SSI family serine proteinase inhibitor n=1 Tax=Streptomyces adustus TaxID=1609272 RepID=UPI0035D98C28